MQRNKADQIIHTHMSMCMHAHMYMCTHTHAFMHTHTHTHTDTHTHMYTHANKQSRPNYPKRYVGSKNKLRDQRVKASTHKTHSCSHAHSMHPSKTAPKA